MNDDINFNGPSLVAFLDRLGLPPAARDRVIEIDQQLSEEIESDAANADRCAMLVFEAADLIADRDPPEFDFSGIEWGEE